MRDILFRGKRIDDGEWVYGSFCMDALEQFNGLCGVDGFIRLFDKTKRKMQSYEVDRETVGQYTGLNDKNGKRIFEGDIIRTHYANTIATDFVEQVVFHNGRFTSLYELHGPGNGKMFANLPDGVPHLPQDKTPYMDWCEVIGNIHDNQELLKEGADNGK